MGRREEKRGGAYCCRAVREGRLCERSSGAREKKCFPRQTARKKCLPPRGICPGSGLRAAEDFFPEGGGTRWKTACRGGAQKRDTFRPGTSGTCCFEKCGEAGSLPAGGRDGCCLLACGGLAICRVTPDARSARGRRMLRASQRGDSSARLHPPRRVVCVLRRAAGCRAQKKAAGIPTA